MPTFLIKVARCLGGCAARSAHAAELRRLTGQLGMETVQAVDHSAIAAATLATTSSTAIDEPVQLAAIDVALIAAYFLMVGVVACLYWLKERSSARAPGGGSTDDFFLAGRSMAWPAIGLSLFVSNIGSEHLVGLAGSAASSGLAVGLYEWSAGIHILVLGFLMAPIYLRARIATLPEYLERRYDRRLRSLLSLVSLAIYVFTKLSVSVFSGATVLHTVFGWPMQLAAIGLVTCHPAPPRPPGLANWPLSRSPSLTLTPTTNPED